MAGPDGTSGGGSAGAAGATGAAAASQPSLSADKSTEASRQAAAFGVSVTDNFDGTVTVTAPPTDTMSGYAVTVTPVDGVNPTPAELGAMERAQTSTAVKQGAAIREAFEAEKANIAEGMGMNRALGRAPTDAELSAEASRALGWDGFEPVPVEATGSQTRADIATAHAFAAHQGFAGSNRDRVAAVAASARTGFTVPAETFAIDPHHGLAGSGHEPAPFSGSGGRMSDTGIAHDTDYFVGYHTGLGPMGSLGDLRAAGVAEPEGLHGLTLTQGLVGRDRIAELERQQDLVPASRDIPQYDPFSNNAALPDGWDITMIAPTDAPQHRGFGAGQIAR